MRCAAARGCSFLTKDLKGRKTLAQGNEERQLGTAVPLALPWVPVPIVSPSPPTRLCVGGEGRGEEARLRGSHKYGFAPNKDWRATNREIRKSGNEGPPPLLTSPPVYFEHQRTTSEMGNPTQRIWSVKPVATALREYAGLKAMAESGNTMKFMNR